jgi:Protein of unknown function (DUF3325)
LKAVLLSLAYVCCVVGFGWLALAMESHWQQVRGATLPTAGTVRALRLLGSGALFVSLLLCMRADHASMAALVWVMTLAVAAMTIAFVLSWRPVLLTPLVAWAASGSGQERRASE